MIPILIFWLMKEGEEMKNITICMGGADKNSGRLLPEGLYIHNI